MKINPEFCPNEHAMILIDTHCHLYLEEFAPDISEVIQRAENEGVNRFYLPSIDKSHFQALLTLEERFPENCIAMTGLHPCSVKEQYLEELRLVEESLEKRRFAAIGEIGLDFYWDRTYESAQYEAFQSQMDWAKKYNIPVVIHSRQSMAETIKTLKQRQDGGLKGIFHCFNDSYESAMEIIELGFYLGIGGVLTYKNSKLPEVLKRVGLAHLVLETDAPYLAPVPFRGKRNESSYLKYIANRLAELKSVDLEEVAAVTTDNARKIFGY
jgi:TatD DNase family protein